MSYEKHCTEIHGEDTKLHGEKSLWLSVPALNGSLCNKKSKSKTSQKMKYSVKVFLLIGFLLVSKFTFSENTISTGDYELAANDSGTISISITNDVSFSAFQFDLVIPEHFTLDESSVALAGREDGHDFSWELLSGNVLRVIAYSISETAFPGTSGPVVQFNVTAGTKPGTYPLVLQNVLVASGGENIVDEIVHGSLTLWAPEITLSPESIDFGDVPLLQPESRNITIQNTGNSWLTVNGLTVLHPDYSLSDETGFTLAAGNSVSRTVQFSATKKGLKEGEVTVTSDCPATPVSGIPVSTHAFAVNEIHLGTATGRSGYTVTLPISINNMEPFTGFQAEILLPEEIQFVPGSEFLTGRASGHKVSADTTKNKLIITVWSDFNTNFSGEDGQVAAVDLYLEGNGGNYPLNFNNAIIADTLAANILSANYNSVVRIKSPSLNLSTGSHNFGAVAVTDSAEFAFTVNNYGDDTLKISSVYSTEPSFQVLPENYPIVIPPSGNEIVTLKFKNQIEGIYSGEIKIRNNDVNRDPATLNVNGETFEPNELQVLDASGKVGNLNYLKINLDNYTNISAFQFDLVLPDGFSVVGDSCFLSERSVDHSLSINNITDNTVRFVSYSGNLETYSNNTGTIATIALLADQETTPGFYNMELQNVILSDVNSENVVSQVTDGQFELQEGPDVPINTQVSSINLTTGTTDCFNATNTITVAGDGTQVIIESGASAEFIAGQSIRFLPGFHAQEGSYVNAHITEDDHYCVEAAPAIVAAETTSEKEAVIVDAGLTEIADREMVVYPNPNSGEFTIEFRNFDDEIKVMLFNSIGQMVYNEQTTKKQIQMSVPNLKSGMYFIKAVNKDKQFNQKIIVR